MEEEFRREFLDDFAVGAAAPTTKKTAAQLEFDKAVENHIIPWLCTLIKHRLYVGPFITQKLDMHHLIQVLGVTHIINMCVATEQVTKKANLNKASWYTCYFDEKTTKIDATLVRLPIPDDLNTLNETKQIAFYTSAAKHVADLLSEANKNVLYVHNKTGFDEEAFTAILAWQMYDKKSFPVANITLWLRENMFERVLDTEEQQALLQKALAQSKQNEKGGMKQWLVSKKQKK